MSDGDSACRGGRLKMRNQEAKKRNRQRVNAAKKRKQAYRLPLPLRAEAMFNAIKNGEVEQVELKGEEAIQSLMAGGFTRQNAEEFVSTLEKANNKLITTTSPFIPVDEIGGEWDDVIDDDTRLFWLIEKALSDPEVNVVLVEVEKQKRIKDKPVAFTLGGRNKNSKVVVNLVCDSWERANRARENYGYQFGLSLDETTARLMGRAA